VAEAMAVQDEPTIIPIDPDDDEDEVEVAEEQVSTGDLARAITALAKGQQALVDSQIRKVPFANHKPRSSFNPTGNKRRKLSRRCYQNGYPMNIVLLHDREIALLNDLKAGKYLNGLVTVRVNDRGVDTTLDILYKNKTPDDKMNLKNEFRSLTEFLERAIKEGPMED
jgi:superfamily II DNA or RNA helicase